MARNTPYVLQCHYLNEALNVIFFALTATDHRSPHSFKLHLALSVFPIFTSAALVQPPTVSDVTVHP